MKTKNLTFKSQTRKGLLIALAICVLCSVLCALTSCKAWRTVTTTATYVQQNDSAQSKSTTTISTKTVEEYQGVKKK